jgi:hypothetical protein
LATAAIATVPNPYQWALLSKLSIQPHPSLCQDATAMRRYLNSGGNPNAMTRGGDVQVKRKDGMTPLAIAAQFQDAKGDKIKLLLTQGADVNAKDNQGKTVLHYLASAYAIEKRKAFELLLAAGAEINP